MLHLILMQSIQTDRERAFRDARHRYDARLATATGDDAKSASDSADRVPVDDGPSHQRNLSPDLGRR
jgi:hypothetical protein